MLNPFEKIIVGLEFLHLCRKPCKSHTVMRLVYFRGHSGEEQRHPPPWVSQADKSDPEGGSIRAQIISISFSAFMQKVRLFSRTCALWLGFCGSSFRGLDLLASRFWLFFSQTFILGTWIGSLSLLGQQNRSVQCLSPSVWASASHTPFSTWNPCHNPPSHPHLPPHQVNIPDIWFHLGM